MTRVRADGVELSSGQAGVQEVEPAPPPEAPKPFHPQATTYAQMQAEQNPHLDVQTGHDALAIQSKRGTVPHYPAQPAGTPYSGDPVPDEPSIQGESLTVGESLSGNPRDAEQTTPLPSFSADPAGEPNNPLPVPPTDAED